MTSRASRFGLRALLIFITYAAVFIWLNVRLNVRHMGTDPSGTVDYLEASRGWPWIFMGLQQAFPAGTAAVHINDGWPRNTEITIPFYLSKRLVGDIGVALIVTLGMTFVSQHLIGRLFTSANWRRRHPSVRQDRSRSPAN